MTAIQYRSIGRRVRQRHFRRETRSPDTEKTPSVGTNGQQWITCMILLLMIIDHQRRQLQLLNSMQSQSDFILMGMSEQQDSMLSPCACR